MARPFVVPDAWQHENWTAICRVCHQPLFLVAVAEARLPREAGVKVVRCRRCRRALWYRSRASDAVVSDYHDRLRYATQQRQARRTLRQSGHDPALPPPAA